MTYLPDRTDVLIVGAGPAGLAAAIELGHRGVRCVVIERNDRVGYSPRAKTTNVRSREHLRRWGIADELRRASPIQPDYPPRIVFATRMCGPLLTEFENAFNGSRVRNNSYSEEAQWVPQYTVEEVMRGHAESLPSVTIIFDTEFVGYEAEDSVTVELRHNKTGQVDRIVCAYLIGADGARSAVRDAIGARMESLGPALPNVSIIFRAPDLARRQIHGRAIMYWLVNKDAPAVLGPMDNQGLWTFMATQLPPDTDFATLDAITMIRRSTGIADLPIEVVGVDPWIARQLVADYYTRDRVFLAGDACHLHPPFGGFGMNMGIGDAVDIGWKIAACLQGWGGPGLLDSYETERRPVHIRTIREAGINYNACGNQLVRPGLEDEGPLGEATRSEVAEIIEATKRREFKTLGLVIGYNYARSPLVVPDGTAPPPEEATVYTASACPGCLAPHVWLADGSSLYDHFGPGFTLLVMAEDVERIERLASAALRRGIPFAVAAPGDERLAARYEVPLALIRPDQHVAWRGHTLPTDLDALLDRVTGRHTRPTVATANERAAAI